VLGWKYVDAEEEAQRYKVGKFILETKRVLRGVCWENDGEEDPAIDAYEEVGGVGGRDGRRDSSSAGEALLEEIEFDSQDEDECEDLFAGVWSPALARKRRRNKLWRDSGD